MFTYLNEDQITTLWWIMNTITKIIPQGEYFDKEDRQLAYKIKNFLKNCKAIEIKEITEIELPF